MTPFLQGVLLGLTFAVLIGPAFFALIQTSIHRGFRFGFFLAIGIFLSDLVALLVCYFGATQILGSDPRQNATSAFQAEFFWLYLEPILSHGGFISIIPMMQKLLIKAPQGFMYTS
jgi:arginine exporter protein ArgO